MSDESKNSESELSNANANNDTGESDVLSKIKHLFGEEICSAFEREEINNESTIADLILRDADAPIFNRLGLNYGKTLKFKQEFSHLKRGQSRSPKPSMADISQMSNDMKQLYYIKRKKIGTHVAKTWGDKVPKFNTPESKAQLKELAERLEPECGMKELNFGADGIAQHIKNFCYEQRRYKKGKKQHDDELLLTTPNLPRAPKFPKKTRKTESSCEDMETDDTESGDTDILSDESADAINLQVAYDPPTDKSSSSAESLDEYSCSQAQPKEKVNYDLNTYQKIVKEVYGKVLNRDQSLSCLKTKFKVPSKHLATLKPSELLACLAKKLIKSGYCSVQTVDDKCNRPKCLFTNRFS